MQSYQLFVLGEEGPKFPSMSEKSMAMVMNAVLRTSSKIKSTYIMNVDYAPRTSVLYSLAIPTEKVEEFKLLCPYALRRHPDIQIGFDIIKAKHEVNE